jgi:hypothetical protein
MGAMIPLTTGQKPGPRSESEIQSAVRLLVGQLPDVRIWRNSVGELPASYGQGRKGRVKFGLCNGSSDLVGIVAPSGRWLCLEIKEEDWRPALPTNRKLFKHEQDQRDWIAVVEAFGGVGGFVTCEAEAMALVERARK